jgi:predicted PolB exonuclease-like 3'-5' exonuclease
MNPTSLISIVFDTETIPDVDLLKTVVTGTYDSEDALLAAASEQIAQNKAGFLPPMFHRMVSWAALITDQQGKPMGKASWVGENEKEGLKQLFEIFDQYPTFTAVHHNGRGFDLPMLTYRAMRHAIPLPVYMTKYEFKNRYSRINIDIQEELSQYGASSWPKLKHLGALVGIPVKTVAEGNQVLEMWRAGELKRIELYCYEDVLGTYLIWLTLRLINSEITAEQFSDLRARARRKLEEVGYTLKDL